MEERKKGSGAAADQARKPYSKPRLIEYGHVEKLTQNQGATTIDHGTSKKVGL